MKPSTHTPAQLWNLEPLLSISEVSDYLGIPVSTLYDWRTRDLGPRAHRIGKHLKYAVSDVRDWVAEQRDREPPGGVASQVRPGFPPAAPSQGRR